MKRISLALCALAVYLPAHGASTEWHRAVGTRLKLVVDDVPQADGRLRGALIVDLEPGWKTYWRDPGEAGVPPSIGTFGSVNAGSAELHFPPPMRFPDAGAESVGYKHPVALAFTLPVDDPQRPVTLKATVFLGICKDICIPVQTEVELKTDPNAGASEAEVAAAFASLPGDARPGFRVTSAHVEQGEVVVVVAELPDTTSKAELFVVSGNGWYFDTPVADTSADGTAIFRIPVLERPKEISDREIDYALVSDGQAVDGTFVLR